MHEELNGQSFLQQSPAVVVFFIFSPDQFSTEDVTGLSRDWLDNAEQPLLINPALINLSRCIVAICIIYRDYSTTDGLTDRSEIVL